MIVGQIPATEEAIMYIACNLRAADAEELYATCWDDKPETITKHTVACGDFRFVFAVDGRPACAIGAAPMWPGVWSMWMFATDDFPRVSLSVTKHVRHVIMPSLLKTGAHRASAASLSTHDTAHKWLQSFGFSKESEMPGFGKNGETFYNFVCSARAARQAIGEE